METKHKPTCRVVPAGKTYTGKQAFTYFAGISAENTGSCGICMHLLIILRGERAKALRTSPSAGVILTSDNGNQTGETYA